MTTGAERDCFTLLAEELRRHGLADEAESLMSSIAAGSTGSECLGLAGQAIAGLRARHRREAAGALKPFLAPCIQAIRKAWPRYS
jgi:hypothetical protein